MRIGTLLATLLLGISGLSVSAGTTCDGSNTWTNCSITNTGSQIDIGGAGTRPGGPGGGSGGGGQQGGGEQGGGAEEDAGPRYDEDGNLLAPGCRTVLCRDGYSVGVIPEVTLADLASFRPAAPTLASEPAGIGIVGMPTNLVSAASAQSIPGELFGYDVVVRFTPSAFRFSYGDGASRSAPSGGASWAALGQPQFTPTATSHPYTSRGDYLASVTVAYRASVSFDGGRWRDVEGVVEVTTGGHAVRIVEARTALVDRTCLENPAGPGC
ncbi:hypothetical protein [Microbacterium caowuchunii]|uniref:PKD domain-containing protein n=1 Tax=Microbacterium caowuchunii TaxID=2614638 RepID=A0A5N0TN35_9MICO|nr:hypothetical protein [Microbacterium caowuchunii]KAA9135881.1 hypothetical protein F6B40_01485 [Microbacterium caowuchunii]